jgi:hypothetical protein
MRSVVLVLLLAGCQEKVLAKVNCEVVQGQGPAVECTIVQAQGTTEVEVCWDFGVRCDSGATLEAARTCTKVKDGGTAKTTIAMDKLKITGACSGNRVGTLTNLTIDGKPAQ